jgi:hypothetical protein
VPVPTEIGDLDIAAANNSPSGSDQRSQADNYLRAHAAFIAQLDARTAVSVKDYGATGDGTTDDTTALQDALDANRNLWFPAGTYKITAALTISSGRKGLGLYGEYYRSKITAAHAGAILSFPDGTTTQFSIIDGLYFNATGTGNGAATAISGDAALAYVMLIDIRNCIFSGSLRRGIDGNFLMAFFTRNSFGSDQTPSGGNTFQPIRLRASDSFMSTLLFDSNQINSANDNAAIDIDWAYSVTFRGKNDFEGNSATDCVIKATDVLGLSFDDGWAESNGAVPFVKLYDGSHTTDPRVSFNNWHHEGVGSGANDSLIDTQESAGGLYSIKNSVIQELTHITRSDSGYDIGAQCLALENNKASGVTPVFIETPSRKGTVTNDDALSCSVGEYPTVGTQFTSTNFPTSTQYGDGCSISLTAGDWDVSLQGDASLNGATMTGSAFFGVSSTSGNNNTGLQFGDNAVVTTAPGSACVSGHRVKLTATTTYYAKVRADYTGGPPQYRVRLSARRVR